eukprot:5954195-Amphidinium_carterae.1
MEVGPLLRHRFVVLRPHGEVWGCSFPIRPFNLRIVALKLREASSKSANYHPTIFNDRPFLPVWGIDPVMNGGGIGVE